MPAPTRSIQKAWSDIRANDRGRLTERRGDFRAFLAKGCRTIEAPPGASHGARRHPAAARNMAPGQRPGTPSSSMQDRPAVNHSGTVGLGPPTGGMQAAQHRAPRPQARRAAPEALAIEEIRLPRSERKAQAASDWITFETRSGRTGPIRTMRGRPSPSFRHRPPAN